jgi:hypothetical protein
MEFGVVLFFLDIGSADVGKGYEKRFKLYHENQSKKQRSMLRFEPKGAHKFKPQHLGGAHDKRVNEYFLSSEARTSI